MSTRAVITFYDADDDTEMYSVYQHSDGYPDGVLPNMVAAAEYAWPLPRYEPMDFAAAYIAANKDKGGGGIYCTSGNHSDIDYRYHVRFDRKTQKLDIDIETL